MAVRLLSIAAALSALIACPAAAEDFAPSSAWNLDYDDDSCALRRMFGTGENRAHLEFRRFGPGQRLQTTIASERMDARRPVNFEYRFGTDAEWREVRNGNSLTLGDGFSGVLFDAGFVSSSDYEAALNLAGPEPDFRAVDWRAVEEAAAAKIDTITLRSAFRRDLTLRLGKFDAPIAALNACIDELMTHWGIDVEAHKTLSRPATPLDFTAASRMMDYPPAMLRRSMPGVVNVRLAIDETGRITACHIQMPLSDPAFEESSCADIQHAFEFDPALDKDGKPIASYWITPVLFKIGF